MGYKGLLRDMPKSISNQSDKSGLVTRLARIMCFGQGKKQLSRKKLLVCFIITVILLVPLIIASKLGGAPAALGIAFGYVACSKPAFSMKSTHALALAIPAAMTGAVAVALRGNPISAACFAALCCLLVAPANILIDSLLAGIPSIAAVLVSVPGDFQPSTVALCMLTGSAVIIALATPFRKPQTHPTGVPATRAWQHAAIMCLAVGSTVYISNALGWSHNYWLPLTLTVLLCPYNDQTIRKSCYRVIGTVVGALLSLVLASILPLWVIPIIILLCLTLGLGYTMIGNYPRQTAFITSTLLLVSSAGSTEPLAGERIFYIAAGAIIAIAITLVVAWVDNKHKQSGLQVT